MGEPSLYERLGRVYAISAVVDYFSDQLVERRTIADENPDIKAWNENEAGARLPGLKFLPTSWACAIAGGPFEYTGLPLDAAHFFFHTATSEFYALSLHLALPICSVSSGPGPTAQRPPAS